MTEKPPKRHRWLQFSLRTLLLATTLTAIGAWWFMRPRPPRTVEPNGLRVEGHRRTIPADEGSASQERVVAVGSVRILDQHGRRLAAGTVEDGEPTAVWRLYHLDGRTAEWMRLRHGEFAGVLCSYDQQAANAAN